MTGIRKNIGNVGDHNRASPAAARVSHTVVGVPHTVARVSHTVARVSHTVARVSHTVARVSHTVARVSHTVARVSPRVRLHTRVRLEQHLTLTPISFPVCDDRKLNPTSSGSSRLTPVDDGAMYLVRACGLHTPLPPVPGIGLGGLVPRLDSAD